MLQIVGCVLFLFFSFKSEPPKMIIPPPRITSHDTHHTMYVFPCQKAYLRLKAAVLPSNQLTISSFFFFLEKSVTKVFLKKLS